MKKQILKQLRCISNTLEDCVEALSFIKGGVGSGRRGHHTDKPHGGKKIPKEALDFVEDPSKLDPEAATSVFNAFKDGQHGAQTVSFMEHMSLSDQAKMGKEISSFAGDDKLSLINSKGEDEGGDKVGDDKFESDHSINKTTSYDADGEKINIHQGSIGGVDTLGIGTSSSAQSELAYTYVRSKDVSKL